MLQLVALIAVYAVSHADVASVPVTVNSVITRSSVMDSNQADELSEWAEYKVKSFNPPKP